MYEWICDFDSLGYVFELINCLNPEVRRSGKGVVQRCAAPEKKQVRRCAEPEKKQVRRRAVESGTQVRRCAVESAEQVQRCGEQ